VFKDRIVEFGRRQFGSAGVLETMSPRQVVLFMAQTAPFSPAERQALLEARGFQDLIDTLAQLLSLNYLTTTPDTSPPSQVN
jgi:Lon protease-like protein